MISGAAQKLPWEGHDFGAFRDATIALLTQTATEGSIWVVEEGPNHLGWRALVGDRGLQLRSRRKSYISGMAGRNLPGRKFFAKKTGWFPGLCGFPALCLCRSVLPLKLHTPPVEIRFFGNNFRSALFTWGKRRCCLQTNHTKQPPRLGLVVRCGDLALQRKNMPFCVRFLRSRAAKISKWRRAARRSG